MSTPFVPGFSPYNVPVRQGKRVGGEPRPAADQQRVPAPKGDGDRRSQPAVDIRLSREALAFLGSEAKAPQVSPVKPQPYVAAPFGDALESASSKHQDAPAARGVTPYAAYVVPGSKINILV